MCIQMLRQESRDWLSSGVALQESQSVIDSAIRVCGVDGADYRIQRKAVVPNTREWGLLFAKLSGQVVRYLPRIASGQVLGLYQIIPFEFQGLPGKSTNCLVDLD